VHRAEVRERQALGAIVCTLLDERSSDARAELSRSFSRVRHADETLEIDRVCARRDRRGHLLREAKRLSAARAGADKCEALGRVV
jgi:hypothetical protein